MPFEALPEADFSPFPVFRVVAAKSGTFPMAGYP